MHNSIHIASHFDLYLVHPGTMPNQNATKLPHVKIVKLRCSEKISINDILNKAIEAFSMEMSTAKTNKHSVLWTN